VKTKRTTKPQVRAFLKDLSAMAEEMGFLKYPQDPGFPRYNADGDRQWVMTDAGAYALYVPDPADPIQVDLAAGCIHFNLHGRFDTTDKRVLRAVPAPYGNEPNPFSGKWNFHGNTAEQALAAFRSAMGAVNARPPTPEEKEAHEIAWLAKAAQWEKRRQEFTESLAPVPA
jgi:hypothetical protein